MIRRWRLLCFAGIGLFVFAALESLAIVNADGREEKARTQRKRNQGPDRGAYTPTDRFEDRRIEGWTVLVNKELLGNQPELAERALKLLQLQLYQVVRKVPAGPLEKLRRVKIWVEEAEPRTQCMAYHPNKDWLRDHGVNPDKAGCIELANVRKFLAWSLEQPWMVLHELAHAYHHQFLPDGFENAEVKARYREAMSSKTYESVLRINGRREKAYAASDHKEFFAEASEAFFGTNDFYPFVKSELQQHDPRTFALLERLWDVR